MAFFGPKWQQIEVFAFFWKTTHRNLLIFYTKHSLWSRKEMMFLVLGKIRKYPHLSNIDPNLAISRLMHGFSTLFCQQILKCLIIFKNWRKNNINHRISAMGAYLFLDFLGGAYLKGALIQRLLLFSVNNFWDISIFCNYIPF